ncbi:peptidoglycan-associated lipoprotein Pal [Orbaceae bacterium ac157xtp]
MRFSKFIKGAAIVLPLIAVTACSSNKDAVKGNVQPTAAEAQQLQQLQRVNTVYFDFDRYNIKPSFAATLDSHAEFLRAHPSFSIVVEGHTDEKGTPEYNIALGERRAAAVKAYLQGRGVASSQINIVSYGKEKPAVLGHDEKAHAKNRRAIIAY